MQYRSIAAKIRKVQKALKIASFNVRYEVSDDMDPRDYAEIDCDVAKKRAFITFSSRKLNEDLDNTVTHELLHLFFYKYLGVAENSFKRQKKTKSLKKYLKGEEEAIRILSSLLAEKIL